MNGNWRLAGALAFALTGTGAAFAADMPMAARPAYKAPPPAIVYTWTGCYLGGNVGGGWSRTSLTDPPGVLGLPGFSFGSATTSGIVGGGQIGCDYQTGPWVFGIQGMFDGSDIKGSSLNPGLAFVPPNVFQTTDKVNWFGTVTGRVGYTMVPTALLYVKGGAAWKRDSYNDVSTGLNGAPPAGTPGFGGNSTSAGWTVGGGAEWMFAPNWSTFVEYDYLGFGSRTITMTNFGLGPATFALTQGSQNINVVTVGLNYRFGLGR